MPRLGRLSGREACDILAARGFMQVRQRGSHVVMRRRAERTTTMAPVPLHRESRPGTLRSIIRQSGLPRALFEEQS